MIIKTVMFVALTLASASTFAVSGSALCEDLPSYADLKAALIGAVQASGGPANGGLDNHMWGTLVAKDGTVCAVAKTGDDINDQWLGSRIISAQKANTANAFSLQDTGVGLIPGLALSTANLFSAVQPGGSLFGLQFSNPVNTDAAYKGGNSKKYGKKSDPMKGERIGGVNVFGGGLALYDGEGKLIGGLGVSGDTSCADHNIAWRTRDALGLDNVPAGLSGVDGDNIIYDIDVNGVSAGGFGHPTCLDTEDTVNAQIVIDHPLGQ
jgi:uncharacterized protein GlcG (DUF336 family)